ncbi:hypothetical protein ABIE13_005271 [Ottowia thiooxydans]|uniref:Uncharacterized protein n=1 Tax=Ottowia thiooxydans TaxID=219182 RepID=A0ABV2QGT8_9BURK
MSFAKLLANTTYYNLASRPIAASSVSSFLAKQNRITFLIVTIAIES